MGPFGQASGERQQRPCARIPAEARTRRPRRAPRLRLGPHVGPGGVWVADLCGEELEEAIGGAVTSGSDKVGSVRAREGDEHRHLTPAAEIARTVQPKNHERASRGPKWIRHRWRNRQPCEGPWRWM